MATRSSTPFPPPSVPFVGPDGLVSRVWLDFLLAVFRRTGSGDGVDISALQLLIDQVNQAVKAQGVMLDELHQNILASVALPFAASLIQQLNEMAGREVLPPPAPRVGSTSEHLVPVPNMNIGADADDWAVLAKASLPAPAAENKGWRRFVSDATGAAGIVPVYSTGAEWRFFNNDLVVS